MIPASRDALLKVLASVLCLGAMGCRPSRDCRPGTAHLVVICDDTSTLTSARVHVQDERLPGGKDVEVPLSCPGRASLELAIADYRVGSTLSVTVTPTAVSGPSPSEVSFPLQLAPECTATEIRLDRTDASLPTDGPEVDEATDVAKLPLPDGAGGAGGSAPANDAAPPADGPGGRTGIDLNMGGAVLDASMPIDAGSGTNLPPGGTGMKDAADATVDAATDTSPSDTANPDVGRTPVDAADAGPDIVTPVEDAAPIDVATEAPPDGPDDLDAALPADLGGPPDGQPDLPPAARCNPSKPFGAPTPVLGLAQGQVGDLRLSPDELTSYFGILNNGQSDLYMATRASETDPFTNMSLLTAFSSPTNDLALTFTADGLTAYLESNRAGDYRIYVSSRAATTAPFGQPTLLYLGSSIGDGAPFVTLTGDALYFDSPGAASSSDLYRVDLRGGAAGQPVALLSLNTTMDETAPLVTADELTIIFGSDRTSPTSRGGLDIWIATRASVSDPFGPAQDVVELATASHDIPTWLSPDGCHLYFDRYDARGRSALVAVRPP